MKQYSFFESLCSLLSNSFLSSSSSGEAWISFWTSVFQLCKESYELIHIFRSFCSRNDNMNGSVEHDDEDYNKKKNICA